MRHPTAGGPGGVEPERAGHTHRNKRTQSTTANGVVFQEVAAVKEYPGGFHLLRVFNGGYALNFYKFKAPLAQEWSERSRPEYGGLSPFYVLGSPAFTISVSSSRHFETNAPALRMPAKACGPCSLIWPVLRSEVSVAST